MPVARRFIFAEGTLVALLFNHPSGAGKVPTLDLILPLSKDEQFADLEALLSKVSKLHSIASRSGEFESVR